MNFFFKNWNITEQLFVAGLVETRDENENPLPEAEQKETKIGCILRPLLNSWTGELKVFVKRKITLKGTNGHAYTEERGGGVYFFRVNSPWEQFYTHREKMFYKILD